MKIARALGLVTLIVLVGAAASLAGGRPPSDAVLLLRDGGLIMGDVFTVNRQSVSMLTDEGIFSYKRQDVSQVVFLADGNSLVLRAEGAFTNNTTLEGSLSYVGGIYDGHPAGRFTTTFEPDPADPQGQRLLVRTNFYLERNTLPRGSLSTLTVSDGVMLATKEDGVSQNHMAGVVLGGSGDFEGCYGTVESVLRFRLGEPNVSTEGVYIFRFDAVHRSSLL